MLLKVQPREISGKKVKNIRKQGLTPASVYGPQTKARNVSLNTKDFRVAFKEAGFSHIFDLETTDGKQVKALFKDVQKDPLSGVYMNVSIYQVDMNKPITADVPVKVSGTSQAVKNNLGLLVTPLITVSVQCLPADLPAAIEVNVDNLNEIGDAVSLHDFVMPKGVSIGHNTAKDSVIAYISAPQKSVEEEEAEAAAAAAAAAEAAGIVPEVVEGEEGAIVEGEEGAAAEGAEAEGAAGATAGKATGKTAGKAGEVTKGVPVGKEVPVGKGVPAGKTDSRRK